MPNIRQSLLLETEALPGHTLYAVIDAARSRSLLPLILDADTERRCLFDYFEETRGMDRVAPWLVRLSGGSPDLFDHIAEEGLGEHWGIYLLSDAAIDPVAEHLAACLLHRSPEGRKMVFRFYDPRVLRSYLSHCPQGERTAFFGPVRRILLENDLRELTPFGAPRDD